VASPFNPVSTGFWDDRQVPGHVQPCPHFAKSRSRSIKDVLCKIRFATLLRLVGLQYIVSHLFIVFQEEQERTISGWNNTIASRGLDLTLSPSRCDPSDNSNHTLRPKETDFQKRSVHITFATL
jgi:hypothetical protein